MKENVSIGSLREKYITRTIHFKGKTIERTKYVTDCGDDSLVIVFTDGTFSFLSPETICRDWKNISMRALCKSEIITDEEYARYAANEDANRLEWIKRNERETYEMLREKYGDVNGNNVRDGI